MADWTRRAFAKTTRAALAQELADAGLPPTTPEGLGRVESNATTTWVRCTDAELPLVTQVVAAHDAAALDAADAALATQDAGDLAGFRAKYQAIRDQAAQLRADAAGMPPAPLTAAQVRNRLIAIENALADLGDATAALARYVGRRPG